MRSNSILVVEDNEIIRDLLKEILEEEGFEILMAIHGQEAMDIVKTKMPDLILLDMKMPIMDGPTFFKIFHEAFKNPCPVIVVTAAEDANKVANEIGATYSVEKPFDIESILNIVYKALPDIEQANISPI